MDPSHIGLFDLAERRLAWADRRQALLAQNVANVNTPRYQPHDLHPFAATLDRAQGVAPARTQPHHMAGSVASRAPNEFVERTHSQSPDGNAVTLDVQLLKVADTETTHALVTTIYRKYLGMFSMALGRGGSG